MRAVAHLVPGRSGSAEARSRLRRSRGVVTACGWPHNGRVAGVSPHLPGRVASPDRNDEQASDPVLDRRYHLVLLDDDDHSYGYVIELLGRVFGYGVEKSYTLACIVDAEGRVIVETGSHDEVDRHQRAIHAFGPDPRIPHCKGSMSAVVEPAR